MAYATTKEATARYGLEYVLISSDKDCDDRIDPAVFSLALDDASAEVDKHLAARYTVPVDVTSPSLAWVKRTTIDVAIYYASMTADVLTEEKFRRYEHAIKQLEKIASGVIPAGPDLDLAAGGPAEVCAQPRRETRDTLCGVL